MFKSAIVGLALVAGSIGGASAATREINAWGARLSVPTYEADDSRHFAEPPAAAFAAQRGARFMGLDGERTNKAEQGTRQVR